MKPIGIFEILARRRLMFFGLIGVLIIAAGVGLGINLFRGAKKTQAATLADKQIISQTDTSYDGKDLIIPAGKTAYIDGNHTFGDLTVNGTLTSTDYNLYGVVNPISPVTDPTADSLFKSGNDEYVFIVRGVINVGTNVSALTFAPANGTPRNYTTNKDWPINMKVDDGASVTFYPAISAIGNIYDSSYWGGSITGYSYGDNSTNQNVFVDSSTTSSNKLIPFELRFINATGVSSFSVAYCSGSCVNGFNKAPNSDNYRQVNLLDSTSNFNLTSATPEAKTFAAWQGVPTATDFDQYHISTTLYDYTHFSSAFASVVSGNGYDLSQFYFTGAYDFANDQKIALKSDDKILTSPTVVPLYNLNKDEAYRNSVGLTSRRTYLGFATLNDYTSPLASRSSGNGSSWSGFPSLSQALYSSMTKKIPTEITLTGTLTVNSGGKINENGRGFAPSIAYNGGGPGGSPSFGTPLIPHYNPPGASHSGVGGTGVTTGNTTNPAAPYDTSLAKQPLLPGSGAFAYYYSPNAGPGWAWTDFANFYGYGGGYINISAKTIHLALGSMTMADGVGGNLGHPMPGASGGSIILQDSDANSFYQGIIAVFGGSCRESGGGGGGGHCISGGGGGGYIYIATASSQAALTSNIDSVHYMPADADSDGKWQDPVDEFSPSISDLWRKSLSSTLFLSAMGGANENPSSNKIGWGAPGIINIVSSSPTLVSIHKSVDKIALADGSTPPASSSPYSLQSGEKILVTLDVTNLTVGQPITIKDEFFNNGTISYFLPVKNSWTVLAGVAPTVTTTDISWEFTPTASTQKLQYQLTAN